MGRAVSCMAKRKIAAVMVAGAIALASPLLTFVEGRENVAYFDTGRVPTVCEGHTGPEVRVGDVWTDEQCDASKIADMKIAANIVIKYVKVPLYEHEFAAILSFVFNVGEGQFRTSTLLKLLNAQMYTEACEQLPRWVYDNGKKLRGLEKRRALEKSLCLGEM